MHTSLAIIGAGPYGLSLAAHAQAAKIPYVLYGEPMYFWKHHMLDTMLLRSPMELTSLSHPDPQVSLPMWMDEQGIDPDGREPITKTLFLDYVADFQRRTGVIHQASWVTSLLRDNDRFGLTAGTTTITADNVVIATGLAHYPLIPSVIHENVAPDSYTHTSNITVRNQTPGQRILVVGGGQSAFEAALDAAESGAQVTLAQRDPAIYYADIHQLLSRMFVTLLSNSPSVFHYLPDGWHDRLRRRMLPTTVAPWIKPLLAAQGVKVWCEATIQTVHQARDMIRVFFADGRTIEVDHIIIGTGYKVDIERHPLFADAALRKSIVLHDGMPHLDRYYQSSIPGLFFAGAMAMHSFGPAYNFIFGVAPQCQTLIDSYLAGRYHQGLRI